MFTGIVQGMGEIIDIETRDHLKTFHVQLPSALAQNIQIGASIANDGCCLTVTAQKENVVCFDVMQETLAITTLGDKKVGDRVNIERSATFGAEIGGHVMSGHIFGRGQITAIERTATNCTMTITVPQTMMPFIFYKGFIGIVGASLTIGEVQENCFKLHLIPETLAVTTLQFKQVGDEVNIEIDAQTQIIVSTVERLLAQKRGETQ